jgi:hypothetical protein
MESWGIGFDGDRDVERHAGLVEAAGAPPARRLKLREVSDYI